MLCCVPWLQCGLCSSLYLAEMLPPVLIQWGSLRSEPPHLLVLMCGVKRAAQLGKEETIWFRTPFLCCSIQHLDESAETSLLVCSVIYGCCSHFTGTELQATLVVIIKAWKNYTWIIRSGPFKKKNDAVTGDNPQALSGGEQSFCF